MRTSVLLRPASFARGWTAVLVGLVLAGITLELAGLPRLVPGFLEFDWTHDLLHIVLLGMAAYYGWLARPSGARLFARVFGLLGLLVAAMGSIPPFAAAVDELVAWHSEPGENVVHGLLGLWGTVAGFRSGEPARTRPPQDTRGSHAKVGPLS
jgi:hypothetical protein